jgi:hypothetical protein
MKLLWIGAFVLLFAAVASLISSGRSTSLTQQNLVQASKVIPETRLAEIQRATSRYTADVFQQLPQQFREKLAQKLWSVVQLMTFRFLVLLYLAPALFLPLFVGLLEGWWARENQKSLITIHSPMRFSLALTGLGLLPILALLWLAAPIEIPALALVLIVGAFAILNTRNVIVHAPTQF